ncbi:MAG TPA: hypothetical protein VEQ42_06270 [Pyrinomonadaceae bacterium]|nr:hypothetical protein [Pyrinomonadaceae bacterium]
MPWVKVSDVAPPEDEQILIHDNRNNRIMLGRRVGGRWYVEDARDGRLTEIAGPTHWAPVLDSESHDDSDDD